MNEPARRELRDRLGPPVAAAITVMWVAAGIGALWSAEIQVFVIASGPFTLLCGYLFGVQIVRRAVNGNG